MTSKSVQSRRGDLLMLGRGHAENSAAVAIPPPPFAWKTRVLLPAALLSIVAAMLAYSARDALWPATPVHVVPVVLKATAAGDGSTNIGESTVQAPGWVEAEPYSTYVTALVDGVIKEMLVLEGQPVEAGQVVARLVNDAAKLDLAKAEAEMQRAAAELAAAEARLKAAQTAWDHPYEHHRAVDAAEAMLAESVAESERLPTEIAVEEARAAELQDQLERAEKSLERDAASEIEVVQTRLKLESQKAMIAATRAKKPALEAKIRQQQAELAAAKTHLELRIEDSRDLAEAQADLAAAQNDLAQAKAERDLVALRLQRMEVRSPVAGTVMMRLKEPGDTLMEAGNMPQPTQVLRLYDPKHLQVRVDVPLADAAKVGVGQSASIVVGVLPDKTFTGKITRVVHEADIQKNTLQVKVAIDKPTPELKPEMLARVKFHGAATTNTAEAGSQVTFAPENALHRDGDNAIAWVVNAHNIAESRTVTLGSSQQDGWIAVTSGLHPGDLLVTGDTSKLTHGMRVKVQSEASEGGTHATH